MSASSKKTMIGTIVLHSLSVIFLLSFLGYEYGILKGTSEPVRQGFYCNDESIKYTSTQNTVPTVVCVLTYLAIAFPLIIFVELISFQIDPPSANQENSLPWKKVPMVVYELYRLLGFFTLGNLFTLNINEICKFQIGRLRPYFLQACKIELTSEMCFDELKQPKYVEWWKDNLCTNSNEHELLEARKSFLSGHASYSFYNAIFLVLYLQIRFTKSPIGNRGNKKSTWANTIFEGIKILVPIIQFVLLALAIWISLTRISDFIHHPSDVVAGTLLGLLVGYFTIYHVLNLVDYPRIFHSFHENSKSQATAYSATPQFDSFDERNIQENSQQDRQQMANSTAANIRRDHQINSFELNNA